MYTPYKWIIFIFGILATMPVLEINIGFISISAFRTMFFIVLVFVVIHSEFCLRVDFKNSFITWMGWSLLSCLFGYIFFRNSTMWQQASVSNITKILAYMMFFMVWLGQRECDLKENNRVLINGLFLGAVANIVWATLDAACFYGAGFSLNNIVFAKYGATHDVIYGTVSLIINNGQMIRSGGFNYDPAHLGFLIPCVIGYGFVKKRYIYVILGGLGIIASASTTALVCAMIVIVACSTISMGRNAITGKRVIETILGILVILFILLYFGERIIPLIRQATILFENRVKSVYVASDVNNIRLEYIRYLPVAIIELGPLVLLGTGYGTASYGYCHNSYIADALNIKNVPYDMENTYIAYLLDTGIVGFVIFAYMIISLYSYYRKNVDYSEENIIIFVILTSTLSSMLFYHYILFVPQILVMIIAYSDRKYVNNKQINNRV